jgi:hypothetical protein
MGRMTEEKSRYRYSPADGLRSTPYPLPAEDYHRGVCKILFRVEKISALVKLLAVRTS